jgi:tetratricopeptide (TPR) repeat protein
MASTDALPALSPDLATALAALKDQGNVFFKAGDYLKAAGAYTKAIKARPRMNQSKLLRRWMMFRK